MSTLLFNICVVDRCSSTLFNEYRHHLTEVRHRALISRAASVTSARLRRRRADKVAPVTPLQRRRRRVPAGFHSLHRLLQRRLDMMTPTHEIRRRSSGGDRNPINSNSNNTAASPAPYASAPDVHSRHLSNESAGAATAAVPPPTAGDAAAPPPSSPMRRTHSRSTSTASRQANRLSLTLPIAPPSGDPSRPTPTPTSHSSFPPMVVDASAMAGGSSVASAADPSDFIIAIAAQERRVLELREELDRAEKELSVLKKRWSSKEVYSRRGSSARHQHHHHATAPPTPTTTSDASEAGVHTPKHSVEFDRKKLLRQQQEMTASASGTPNRRRVIRGGHTRTLSLLSPTKPDSPGFPAPDDDSGLPLPPVERRAAQLTNPNLAKRASWQPQHSRRQSSVTSPGIVEDFRLGLRSFVEDLRQITVGDEPITGHVQASSSSLQRKLQQQLFSPAAAGDDTIRATNGQSVTRPKATAALYDAPASVSASGTSTTSAKAAASGASIERPKPAASSSRTKHFSWTPLSFDSLDDSAWTNWESPVSAKSTARWSGSSINSAGGGDDIESIPEAREETDESSPTKSIFSTFADGPVALPPKLGEMLPSMVNRLSPTNIKRTADNFMNEWERSLVDPDPSADKESVVSDAADDNNNNNKENQQPLPI
ncbi:hypothetical protein GMORB2_2882 [Geosmithia morbida]|uniref:DUF4048 domain-containing protein n=1 Tax=Geosmithia morbida TaxID=1094350 RepID=A0A9P4YRT1_9HYPO|nr:uncharacterized protein GMORB2_2882 [Geosmithia morbida]KAF4120446.1 hypothetical protein GMORB2_2882 [Geosmithia morbida]